MTEKQVSEKKVKTCSICGEKVAKITTSKGVEVLAAVYHSQGQHVVLLKNNSVTEHFCIDKYK